MRPHPTAVLLASAVCCSFQGYGSTFIKQYVHDSGAGGDMNVGEFWADLHWEDGGEQTVAHPKYGAAQRTGAATRLVTPELAWLR